MFLCFGFVFGTSWKNNKFAILVTDISVWSPQVVDVDPRE